MSFIAGGEAKPPSDQQSTGEGGRATLDSHDKKPGARHLCRAPLRRSHSPIPAPPCPFFPSNPQRTALLVDMRGDPFGHLDRVLTDRDLPAGDALQVLGQQLHGLG